MAYIPYLPEEAVPEENRVSDHDNILRISRVHSKFMRQHYEMFIELMKKRSPLSRAQREMIAVVVSAVNECHYWVQHHGAGLRRALSTENVSNEQIEHLIRQLTQNYKTASVRHADRLMLDYAVKLTQNIQDMHQHDVQVLQDAGFSDRAIHDICVITGYFGFVNRIAEGLGVGMESEE